MSKTIEQIREELDAKIPREAIAEREGGGRKLSYLEGWYVIDRLNEVFGQGNWEYQTQEMRQVYTGTVQDKYGKDVHVAHYISQVCLHARIGDKSAVFSDYGYGDGSDKQNPGKAHELAVKEAVTDGIKRCAKNLGMSMGLALYDKTQENVDDGQEAKPAPRAVAQSVAKPKPQTIAAPKPAQAPAPVAAAVQPSTKTEAAPLARKDVNAVISKIAGVLADKAGQGEAKKAKFAEIKAYMMTKYGVDKKESLTDVQATELYAYLEGQLNG